ncbi:MULTISPECIES: potassium channel family protein [Clostridium]|nr:MULTISPECIES: TrkA family potassium uptake protein [Clostridium]MBP8311492.1 TrkA family potassium uptake protein [Clostridium neonatale]MBS4783289.1 TrkA family potassium uptake protein [Clostridium sp.]MDU4476163.1 TrkA family potassium uptake protein [Clostridium sp.]MDU4847923.1 TrkA family potassium uptake protein [Clostridium sp.]PEG26203.1 TrkA family potassium uptake protein [Clostridium neonatale]
MSKKQFLIIGLGRFGSSIAKTIYELGHDVLAIDKDEEKVQEISDYVTHAVQMDSTDESILKTLGVTNFDVAVVTIGSNLQDSVMATLILKELGVKYIIAKANNELHAKVLTKIGADKVVLPERDMGTRVAHNLVSSNILDYIELSEEYSILEIEAIKEWFNKSLKEIEIRKKHGINVVAIKRGEKVNISPSAEDIIKENDVLVALGSAKDLNKFESMISRKNK